jgi:hypothetical protein
MKVDINLSELKGMWRKPKAYSVDIAVQFSQEEIAMIKSKKLGSKVVSDWTGIGIVGGASFHLSIDHLLTGSHTNLFVDRSSAQAFADSLAQRMVDLEIFLDGGTDQTKDEPLDL